MFNRELEGLKRKMSSAIAEMRNNLERANSRLMEAEKRISEMEDRVLEITATEKDKEKRSGKTEESLRDIWNNITHTNFCIIEFQEEKRERARENM